MKGFAKFWLEESLQLKVETSKSDTFLLECVDLIAKLENRA
jgi:hypothetical protein